MKKAFFILLYSFMCLGSLWASRPTVHASNFKASLITCNSLQLNWSYGDGAARLIVVKEGSAPTWVPSDLNVYGANRIFGKGFDQGGGQFVVYNAVGTNYIKIDSLLTGKTYYFTIYEHDNATTNTLYYTANSPPTVSATTHVINLNYGIKFLDSCEEHNLFEFTNNSNSTIPGIKYTFDFGDGNTSSGSPVNHSYKKKSGLIGIRLNATPGMGCVNNLINKVRVYPKKVAYIDTLTFEDTMCLEGNYFEVDPAPLISPLPKSFTYMWNFGDGEDSVTFKKMKKSYAKSGHYFVEVEITTNVNLKPSGCKDTLRLDIVVLPSPVGKVSLNDTFQCLTNNKFTFSNNDNSLTYFKWYYGNNDSTDLQTFSYSYPKVGKDTIIHVAYAATGCKGRDTVIIEVLPDLNSDFLYLDPQYCSSNNPVKNIVPVTFGGKFEGFALDPNNSFIPAQIGKHQLSYILNTSYCEDTTTKKFEIFPTPDPDLGPDVAICNPLINRVLSDSKSSPGTHLWNTGVTNSTITVNNTGTFWLDVTNGSCTGHDTINVVYSTKPILELGKDSSVCKGNKLVLKVGNPKSTYLWQDGSTDSIYFVYSPGKYTVKVTNPCGVVDDSIFVFFQTDYCDLFMANAFSPDNDLINSVFIPLGKNITVELFQIYNKWGQMVFETDKDNIGWNGQYMGKPAPQDLYVWKLFYTTPSGRYLKKSNASGTVLLLR